MGRIGTDSIGSLHQVEDYPDEWVDLLFEMTLHLQSYTLTEDLGGLCTASLYCYKQDSDAGGYPVLFSDSEGEPGYRLSSSEQWMDLDTSTPGWFSGTFRIDTIIPAGTTIWFGFMSHYMIYPTFDEGGECHLMWLDGDGVIPSEYGTDATQPIQVSQYFDFHSAVDYQRNVTEGNPAGDEMQKKLSIERIYPEVLTVLDLEDRIREIVMVPEEVVDPGDPLKRITQGIRSMETLIDPLEQNQRCQGHVLYLLEESEVWDYPIGRIIQVQEVLELHSGIDRILELNSPL